MMNLSPQKIKLAKRIDAYVVNIWRQGGHDEHILQGMYDYMGSFKQLLDTCLPGEIDWLCEQYDGFYHFAKLLENLAGAIASGHMEVPPE